MSNREKQSSGYGDCGLRNPEITWGKYASGELISALFLSWRRGQLHSGVQRAISRHPPGLWELLEESTCKVCPHLRPGRREDIARNPLFQDMGAYYFELVTQEGPRMRRLLIILNLLGPEGSRPGGYLRQDIEKMAGTLKSRSMTDRLILRLCRLGLLTRRKRRGSAPRYNFIRNGDVRLAHASLARRDWLEARWITNKLRELLKRDPELNVVPVEIGMIVGEAPPTWFLTFIRHIQKLELLCWKNAEFNYGNRTTLGLPGDYSRKEIEREIGKVVSGLITWSRSLKDREHKEWEAYWESTRAGGRVAPPIQVRNLFDFVVLQENWKTREPWSLYAGPDVQSCSLDGDDYPDDDDWTNFRKPRSVTRL
jgi:hypothetical protein